MKNNEITKREELCELLNMNFDEAGELFSDETMQSMQMAQVNGGVVWVGKLMEMLACGVASETISGLYNEIKDWLFGKPTGAGGTITIMNDSGQPWITIQPQFNGNINIRECRDSTGTYYRDINITQN